MQATARRVDTAGGGAKRVTAAGSAETGASPNVSPDAALDAPVDLVHLARHTLGNRDLEREVLRLFVLQSRMLLERMRETGDEAALGRLLHTLLGSARGIGAWQVARSVERQQEALDAGLSADLADVGAAVAAAGVFIEDILRG